VKIRLIASPLGRSSRSLDELVWGYNREFLLYWVGTVIETANQLYNEHISIEDENKQQAGNDIHSLQKPIRLATRIQDITSNSPIEIEVPNVEGYKCVREAISRHIIHMPLTVRELFRNITRIANEAEA
jgi:hypothetical protein